MWKKQVHATLWIILIWTLGWQVAGTESATFVQAATVQITATAGFDNFYKTEFWVPLQIAVSNTGLPIEGRLQVEVESAAAGANVVYETPVSLPTQSNKLINTYLFLPNIQGRLTVVLLDKVGRTIRQIETDSLQQIEQTDLLYVVISPEPDELTFLETVKGGRLGASVAFMELDQLPALSAAWHAIDILVINDVDSAKLTVEQQAALHDWVQMGGQLVITGGANWQKTTAAFTDFLPVSIIGTESVTDLPALSNTIGVPFRDLGPYILTTSNLTSGELLYHQEGMPILARQKYGRGQLYFLALDPKLAPLKDWDGNEILWNTIATDLPQLPFWALGVQNPYTANTAVSTLPALVLPSTFQLLLFLLFYIITIGPANYLILKQRGHLEWAWFTTPAIILLFSGLTYLTGFQIRGNETIINQLSIAYGVAGSDTLRTQTVVGLYSPRRTNYDLTFDAQTLVRPLPLDFGTASTTNPDTIVRSDSVTVQNTLVDISGVKALLVDSYLPAPTIIGEARLELSGSEIILSITIQNNSDITLENATLIVGLAAIPVGTLPAGESQTINQSISSSIYSGNAISYGGGTTPLSANYPSLLGSSDYYNDRELHARFQLLESFSPPYSGTSPTLPEGVITLVGWSTSPQLTIDLDKTFPEQMGGTFYFLEIPYTQLVNDTNQIVIPRTLWNWEMIGSNGGYSISPENLYLSQNWVEFEFQPWLTFQQLQVSEFLLLLEEPDYGSNLPQVRLWNWAEEEWVEQPDVSWGETAIQDFAPYVGVNNAVRVRLQSLDTYSTSEVKAVYPVLKGELP